mgnify:CR=1 FL=1
MEKITGLRLIVIALILLPLIGSAQYNRGNDGPLVYKVFFDTSDFHLDERDHATLANLVKMVKQKPGILFEVSGHTDTLGSKDYNYKLSLKRAEAVKDFLIGQGVGEANLFVVGRGEDKPFRHRGKYSDKFSRRVEFRQVIRFKGRLVDDSGRGIQGKVVMNIPNKPLMNQERLTQKDGSYEFVVPWRPKYYAFGFVDGYISANDSVEAKMKTEGASNISRDLVMKKAVIKEKIDFDNIYFFPASHKVMPKSEPSIQEIAKLMTDRPEIYIEIRGHVNQPNRDQLPENVIEDGNNLSFARAQAVYTALVKMGINASRIKYRGMGSTEMRFPQASTEEENEANRRVEIVILSVGG